MTDNEKIDLIDSMELQEPSEENLAILHAFSYDNDAFVRSRCAAVLVNYSGEDALRTLLRLANDEDAFVRTEAYDSLALFPCRESELLLRHSIYPEDDLLAARYAILSWADVTAALHNEYSEQSAFVQKMLADDEFSDCHVECDYALYLFGDSSALDRMLEYLQDAEYTIRCTVLNRCSDLADEENAGQIETAVRQLLQTEETRAVTCEAKALLEHLQSIRRKEERP